MGWGEGEGRGGKAALGASLGRMRRRGRGACTRELRSRASGKPYVCWSCPSSLFFPVRLVAPLSNFFFRTVEVALALTLAPVSASVHYVDRIDRLLYAYVLPWVWGVRDDVCAACAQGLIPRARVVPAPWALGQLGPRHQLCGQDPRRFVSAEDGAQRGTERRGEGRAAGRHGTDVDGGGGGGQHGRDAEECRLSQQGCYVLHVEEDKLEGVLASERGAMRQRTDGGLVEHALRHGDPQVRFLRASNEPGKRGKGGWNEDSEHESRLEGLTQRQQKPQRTFGRGHARGPRWHACGRSAPLRHVPRSLGCATPAQTRAADEQAGEPPNQNAPFAQVFTHTAGASVQASKGTPGRKCCQTSSASSGTTGASERVSPIKSWSPARVHRHAATTVSKS